jgi:tRNA-Thr(GGU) m(6)t(6)A37 methyltransferase TsaA
MDSITFSPIGKIHTPHQDLAGMPIQPTGAKGVQGKIEILPEFVPGLQDLEGFSYLILLYHFHLSNGYNLTPKPFLDTRPRGVFATRAPRRPNPIGLSIVRLDRIQGENLYISDADMMDGTPLLDIKPYVPDFDHRSPEKIGWLSGKVNQVTHFRSDKRFHEP